jgi:UDP:flavonoid glycosyltransferase YjiC (YdhE family)
VVKLVEFSADPAVGEEGGVRLLVATWDGAGNLPPILTLTTALATKGHVVEVLAHNVQRVAVESAGGVFIPYASAPQWDHGVLGAVDANRFMAFDQAAGNDVLEAAQRLGPAAVLVDCMMPGALTAVKGAGWSTVALVHGLYSFFAEAWGGRLRGPIDQSDLALGLSYSAFDATATVPRNFHFVGPARPDLEAAVWTRRRPDGPFVVASLSTAYQRPDQPDLLQRVCDALAALDVEALVTTGRGIAPESLTVGPNTVVERMVPHAAVLGQADLLVTHAGHGTVMAAVRFGVPMLCLPPAGDQPFNAARVAELGLGVAMDPASSSEDIRGAVERLLKDEVVRLRSRRFAADVAQSPGVETAVGLVESLAITG